MQDAHDAGRKGRWSLIARIAVATGAILWVLWGQDWRELGGIFQSLSPWSFTLALAVYAASQMIITVRWWLLLRAQSIYIDLWAAVRLFFLGLFYNNLMLGSVGGDLLKAWYVTKHTDKRLAGVLSVFVDRAIGLAGLILIAISTYLMFLRGHLTTGAGPQQAGTPGRLVRYHGAILWVAVAAGAVCVALLAHPAGRAWLARMAEKVRGRGISLLCGARDAVVVYCSRPWTLLWALTLTLLAQSVVIVAYWLLGRNLGIEAGLSYYFFVFPVIWVVGAVPISIAGWGLVEAGTVGLFAHLTGMPAGKVLALALCQRFIWILASLPGGAVHLLGTHLPEEEISIDGPERTN